MKIGLDVSAIWRTPPTGVGRYVAALASGLATGVRGARKGAVEPVFFARLSRLARGQPPALDLPQGTRVRLLGPVGIFARRGLALFHGPDVRLPNWRGVPMVATIHDLAALISDEFVQDRRFREKRLAQYRFAADRARIIITHSRSTRDEVVRRLGVPRARVRVVPIAPGPEFHPPPLGAEAATRHRHGLDADYILCVAEASPRKNLPRVVASFANLVKVCPRRVDLVVVGGGDTGPVRQACLEHGVGERVRVLGFVPAEDLVNLYGGALALVHVPLYEGFGLPVLEAMACGTPVVASAMGAVGETAGDAALPCRPDDTLSIVEAMVRVVADLALRRTLKDLGLARAKSYNPAHTAMETLKAYQDALRLTAL